MGHRTRRSPFTGMPAEPASVLAVKVDNHRAARPHSGLEDADIVFVEPVEGGLSRLLAVYASRVPGEIGPVRSMREHNVEQLAMFRRPALAYSGAQQGVEDLIDFSPLWARSHDDFPDAYGRRGDREAPHNLYLTPDLLLKDVPDADPDSDIGWRFGAVHLGGEPTGTYEVRYEAAAVGFTWSQGDGRWLASFDGETAVNADGTWRLGPATVVVQRVAMPASRYQDSTGTTPYVETVGSGEALILRDGEAFEAYWERECMGAGTEFWLKDGGEQVRFAPGQVWVVYEEAE